MAESLGKDGTGVVPIVGEPLGDPDVYGDDRLFLAHGRRSTSSSRGRPPGRARSDGRPTAAAIGHLVVTIELATALAGAALGVQPFDQPDVAAAKAATNEVLAEGGVDVAARRRWPTCSPRCSPATTSPSRSSATRATTRPHVLDAARVALRDRLRVAVSLGFGPRFLHSTGQLHKGGPQPIVCVQAVGADHDEIPIPGQRLRLRPPEAGPGGRRPAHPPGARASAPAASTSTSSWRWRP